MKTYGGEEAQLHSFLTTSLDGDELSTSLSGRINPVKDLWYPLSRRLNGSQNRSIVEKR